MSHFRYYCQECGIIEPGQTEGNGTVRTCIECGEAVGTVPGTGTGNVTTGP